MSSSKYIQLMVYCHSTPPRLRNKNKFERFINSIAVDLRCRIRTEYLRSTSDMFLGIMGSQDVVYMQLYYYFRLYYMGNVCSTYIHIKTGKFKGKIKC